MRAFLVSAAFVALLVFPAGSLAGTCAPPGNSGVSQYLETVPGAGCSQQPPHPGHHGGGRPLSASTSRQLAAAGATGRAVEQLVSSSGTVGTLSPASSSATSVPAHSRTRARANPAVPATPGRGVLSGLLHPIVTGSSSGGMGIVLPLLLAAALALVVGWRLLARRRVAP